MPAALPIPIRKEIVERRSGGQTFRQIAREMKLSYYTVRTIWQHWQRHDTLEPNDEARASPLGSRVNPGVPE